MTIRFIRPWNGYNLGARVTLSGAEETRLIGLGIARSDYVGDNPSPKHLEVLTDSAQGIASEAGGLVPTIGDTPTAGPIPAAVTLPTRADVVIHGASFDGCVAAIAAARMGCSVVVLEPGTDYGGMPASGLGQQDWRGSSYGGMTPIVAEIFRGACLRYGIDPQTANLTQWAFTGKPFHDEITALLILAGVRVYLGWRPKESSAVTKLGKATKSVVFQRTSDATVQATIAADQWIDAYHHPDVARQAGVTFVTGRESSAEYTEANNGVTAASFTWNVSGYVIPGNTGSGLLPNVEGAALETAGAADARVMPPCVRIIMTQTAGDGVAMPEPDMSYYDPARYEFMRRLFVANHYTKLQGTSAEGGTPVFSAYALADGRRAWNNATLGLNAIGLHQEYATAYDYATRDAIDYRLRQYHLGLFYFLRTSPDVPQAIKDELATWKLKDGERYGPDGIPFLTYHREVLRMRGEYVLTQGDVMGTRLPSEPVLYGPYKPDVHYVSLRATAASQVVAEGLVQSLSNPTYYGIDRRVSLPKRSESTNIQVSHCVSSTHIGWASVRIDPVLGGIGEMCGIRAALAIKNGLTIHEISGESLRSLLRFIDVPATVMLISGTADVADATTQTVTGGTIDFVGAWTYRAGFGFGILAGNAWDDNGSSKGSKSVKFKPTVSAGRHKVQIYMPPISGASADATVEVKHARGTDTLVLDLGGGGDWMFRKLGEYYFAGDGSDYVKFINTGTGQCRVKGLAVTAITA